jgi:hypothetical protein
VNALRHLLTPGTPAYAALKIGAVGGVLGLQHVVRRRAARDHHAAPREATSQDESRTRPHPRSRKKRRRRRR